MRQSLRGRRNLQPFPTRRSSDLDEERDHIAALAAEVSVPRGKELVREGDYSYDVLAIEEGTASRSEEHTSELQSHVKLVCRLLLEKKRSQAHPGLYACPATSEPS